MPGVSDKDTLAWMSAPVVLSTSSPPSLRTLHWAVSPCIRQCSKGTSTVKPLGVRRETVSGQTPVSNLCTAPDAASAAQVPVVYPQRSCLPSA